MEASVLCFLEPGYDVCMPYTKGSVKNNKKGSFYSCLASDEITTRGYRVLTFAKCTTVMTAVLTVTSGLGSSFD
jgi:hypothetical protein